MLRDKSLIPLSHQHQRALALCVRIDRASPIPNADLGAWQTEIAQHFRQEIQIHFAAEEAVLFPKCRELAGLAPLVEELLNDHAALREWFAKAETGTMSAAELSACAEKLSTHIRKEERLLFEGTQELLSAGELAALGVKLAEALKDAIQACAVPTAATKLRAKADSPPADADSE
jgi:iron-sulfur cluster repair protein YtfE (RIC family)